MELNENIFRANDIRGIAFEDLTEEVTFALGKASEDIKDFDKSFLYYTTGNNPRRKDITFSLKKEKEEF